MFSIGRSVVRHTWPSSAALFLVLAAAGCDRPAALPDTDDEAYAEAVANFHAGIAALQAGEAGLAEESFRRVTERAEGEPAGWANLALTALARRETEEAGAAVQRAVELAPESGEVQLAAALVARERGETEEAVRLLRSAVEREPSNTRAAFLLAQLLEREGGEVALREASALMDGILAVSPENLVAGVERARLAALNGGGADLEAALDRLEAEIPASDEAAAQIEEARAAAADGDMERAARAVTGLDTRLQRFAAYRDDREGLRIAAGGTDVLLTRFLRLPVPTSRAGEPDLEVSFAQEPLAVGEGEWDWVRALWLGDEIPVVVIAAGPERLGVGVSLDQVETFPFPGGGAPGPVPPSALAFVDYDYDFRIDLAVAGAGGLRVLRQAGMASFEDVTDELFPAPIAAGDYAGVWAADLDMEGDMDLVVARTEGPPLVLLNLGDERFEPADLFPDVDGLREMAWADVDGDGDPDAVLLDADGRVHFFENRRFREPRFLAQALPDSLAEARALTVADLDRDALLDLVLLQAGGVVRRASLAGDGWSGGTMTEWPELEGPEAGRARVFVADLDNNGDQDLVVAGPGSARAWLSTPDGLRSQQSLEARITDVADLSGEGRLDLIGITGSGEPALFANQGSRDYYSTTLRPRAARAMGDRRINSFGIGGEIEIRAGLLYQKRPITGHTVHFGLGDHAELDVARIAWPNGTVQAEFGVPATNEAVTALQRLKGSCPWVFAWNGSEVEFVTDFLWRTALGLRINAQGDAAVVHAEDWIRLRGDQVVPRDGYYDVRITGELWESHFFDQVALMAVDHPEGTEVFVDERFVLPAPVPAVHLLGALRPVEDARDDQGRDVSDLVAELDERYLDTFELGPYQGMAGDHWVEVGLGEAAAEGEGVWLVASGWVYPTDGSINFALAQRGGDGPRGVRVQVPDGNGGWSTLEDDFGFPAGKTKTILVDLTGAFPAGTEPRVRLGTNMEVYWDRLAWATAAPDSAVRTTRLAAAEAELRYRGFSETRYSRRTPEIPVYDRIEAVTPVWRDLVGYHTRFGDVRPLLVDVDDRYVIMNAGDEMALRFEALPDPPKGWTRDFVLIGDGWVKDGDFNNGFSKTLMPLPYHGMEHYDRVPTRLEDDPAYRRHPDDWREYHTRYVTPDAFFRALAPE
jgi:tetratricopeptide (TPR) repeat protein